jgi:hypothetical protein
MGQDVRLPFRLAAIDLDDTLLGPDKKISRPNREALERLRAGGIRPVLASGRRHENMLRFHQELGLDGLIISSQGALVRHAETDETLHQHLMPANRALEAIRRGEAHGLSVVVYHPAANYTRLRTRYTGVYEERTASRVIDIPAWEPVLGEGVLKLLWLGPGDWIATLLPEVRSRWDGVLEVLTTDPEYLELMPREVSKAVGVEVAARHYGIAREQVLAFGDGNNDASMLQWAGLGIAMSHGRPSAHAAADRIAPPGDPETDFARAVDALIADLCTAAP